MVKFLKRGLSYKRFKNLKIKKFRLYKFPIAELVLWKEFTKEKIIVVSGKIKNKTKTHFEFENGMLIEREKVAFHFINNKLHYPVTKFPNIDVWNKETKRWESKYWNKKEQECLWTKN